MSKTQNDYLELYPLYQQKIHNVVLELARLFCSLIHDTDIITELVEHDISTLLQKLKVFRLYFDQFHEMNTDSCYSVLISLHSVNSMIRCLESMHKSQGYSSRFDLLPLNYDQMSYLRSETLSRIKKTFECAPKFSMYYQTGPEKNKHFFKLL